MWIFKDDYYINSFFHFVCTFYFPLEVECAKLKKIKINLYFCSLS